MNTLKVSELAIMIKKSIESIGFISVLGEISGFLRHSSGNIYFAVKDESAVINCVCWKNVKFPLEIKNGDMVVCHGLLTAYLGGSRYQITIKKIECTGEGKLLQIIEKRKKELKDFFNITREIPKFPSAIGIITSPTGAVIQDILIRFSKRFVQNLYIESAIMQGQQSTASICKAIDVLNDIMPEQSVIIIARGGGSVEDLWSFNDEELIKKVSGNKIPIISAIGHETDTTLVDFAADLRAPTPTAAAEVVAQTTEELLFNIDQTFQIIKKTLNKLTEQKADQIKFYKNFFSYNFLDQFLQKSDNTTYKFESSFNLYLQKKKSCLIKIQRPDNTILFKSTLIRGVKLDITSIIENKKKHLNFASNLLEGLSYKKVLSRGFCIMEKEHIIKHISDISVNDSVKISMFDGSVNAKVIKVNKNGI